MGALPPVAAKVLPAAAPAEEWPEVDAYGRGPGADALADIGALREEAASLLRDLPTVAAPPGPHRAQISTPLPKFH